MDDSHAAVKHIDRLIWALIAAMGCIVLSATVVGTFHIDWASFLKATAACVLLCAAGWFYLVIRKDRPPATALLSTAQIASFAAVAAPLSYVAASAGLPLWDSTYAAWDRALGLDWNLLLATMDAYPSLHRIFALAYGSFAVQATTIAVTLAIANHPMRVRIFVLSFIFATIITIAISTIMPAQGVWGHLHLTAEDYPAIIPATRDQHLAVFHGLRDGTFRSLVGDGAEGIITFPSLHAALALLFIFALWPIRYLRWIAIALNVIMIASTPIDGGHYFSDAIAGLAIATLCWFCAGRIARSQRTDHTFVLPRIADAGSIAPDITASGPDIAVSLKPDQAPYYKRADVFHER